VRLGLLFRRRDLLPWGVYAEQHDHGNLWWGVLRVRQHLLRNHLLSFRSGLLQRHLLHRRP
jgi:hypothetical protein